MPTQLGAGLVIRNRQNILIVGGTGSGKTTLAKAILAAISDTDDRMLRVADSNPAGHKLCDRKPGDGDTPEALGDREAATVAITTGDWGDPSGFKRTRAGGRTTGSRLQATATLPDGTSSGRPSSAPREERRGRSSW